MKKTLFLSLFFLFNIVVSSFGQVKLNSYAYDVAGTYTSSTGILSVSWKLNADAAAIKIVAKDSDGEYVLKEYGALLRILITAL